MIKRLFVSFIIAFLILSIFLSTIYTVNYCYEKSRIVGLKKDEINMVRKILSKPQLVKELALSNLLVIGDSEDFDVAQFLPSMWRIVNYRNILAELEYPHLFLSICSSFNATCALLIDNRNYEEIINTSRIVKFIINMSNITRIGNYIVVLSPHITPPSRYSYINLVHGDKLNTKILMLSLALSLVHVNYGYVYYLDNITLIKSKWLVLPSSKLYKYIIKHYSKPQYNVVVFNFDGSYKPIQNLVLNDAVLNIKANYKGMYLSVNGINNRSNDKGYIHVFVPTTRNKIIVYVQGDDTQTSVVSDDNLTNLRVRGLYRGYGNLSLPTVSLSPSGITNNTSLLINVTKGGVYGQWQVEIRLRSFNASEYDYFTFYWYGREKCKEYVVQLITPTGSLWYAFTDNWLGWRKIYLPLKLPDGKYAINNVTIRKATIGNPTIKNITLIEIRNSIKNLNLSGIFMINRLAFEHAPTLKIEFNTHDRFIQQFKINITTNKGQKIITSNANEGYGYKEKESNIIKVDQFTWNTTGFVLALTMVPGYRYELFINPYENITLNTKTAKLNKSYNIMILSSPRILYQNCQKVEVKYLDSAMKVPLVIYNTFNSKQKLYFINVFPLYIAYKNGLISFGEFIRILEKAFQFIDFFRKTLSTTYDIDFVNLYKVVLKDIEAKGNITIKPLAGSVILLPSSPNQDKLVVTVSNGTIIRAQNLRVVNKEGYYATIQLENITLCIGKKGCMHLGNARVITRGFELKVQGYTKLYKLYTFKDLYAVYKIVNKDIEVRGNIRLTLNIFDKYMAGNTLQINGIIRGIQLPRQTYMMDLDFLIHVLPVSLVLTIVFFYLTCRSFKKNGD